MPTGTLLNDKHTEYEKKNTALWAPADSLFAAWQQAKQTNDTVTVSKVEAAYDKLEKQSSDLQLDFIGQNVANILGVQMAERRYFSDDQYQELDSVMALFDPALDSTRSYLALNKLKTSWQSVQEGQLAPVFSQADTSGVSVSLDQFRGSYLLVDFWASWCGPCRAENPNVVAAYKKYHDKGFEILGVSYDSNRDNWIKAIKKDRLTWYHVSDLQGWHNATAA